MAQDVIVRGVTYSGVEKLSLPVSGGSALFRDTSDADASASDVLSGKKAFNANGEINGSMPNQGAASGTISDKDTPFQIPQGYHNGSGSVEIAAAQKALLVPGNIRDSVTILGVTGNYTGGGGPTASDAVLLVTVPANSTVTATKGQTTLVPTMWTTAADSSLETALFVIGSSLFDSVNPWTVTATLGTNTASDTITINSNKEYDLELSYILWIIKDGIAKVETILCGTTVVQDPDYYVLSVTTATGSGKGASWLISSSATYSSVTFVFSKDRSTLPSGNSDRCGIGTGLVQGGSTSQQTATYTAWATILPLSNTLETRTISLGGIATQGYFAQVSSGSGSAAGSRVFAIKDIYLSP